MKDYTLQLGNMKKPQDFTLYPYSGGDFITLQSDKRIARINLHNGKGEMLRKNCAYPNFLAMAKYGHIDVRLVDADILAIQKKLWDNDGKDVTEQGVLNYENKKLFINSNNIAK